jgi:hypothetical protein
MKYLKCVLTVLAIMMFTSIKAEEIEPVHFAYANYLGSGIYRTTGQNASLISMPFSYELGKEGKTTYGLRLPISVGFFDFELADLPSLDLPDGVGTITFTPGIAFSYQYSQHLAIESYIDIGYGRNLTTNKSVNIHSSGLSTLYDFDWIGFDSIWANRLYFASYDGNGYDAKDSYAAIQTGIDFGLPLQYKLFGYPFQPRVFATAFWYFSEVDFLIPSIRSLDEKNNVSLTNSLEVGFTMMFAKKIGYSWAGIDRLGVSYRYSKNFSAFRLLFSFPI